MQVGGQRVGSGRGRGRGKKRQDPGEPSTKGIRCKMGAASPNATSQAWRAPPGWDARAAETWESIGSLQACQRPRRRSEPATKNSSSRSLRREDHGIVRGHPPVPACPKPRGKLGKENTTHEDRGGHDNERGREFDPSRIQKSNGGRVQQRRSIGTSERASQCAPKSPFGGLCYIVSCSTSTVPGLLEAVNQHNIPG